MSNLDLYLIDYADYTNLNDISNALLNDIRKQSINNKVPIPVPIKQIATCLDIVSISPLTTNGFEGAIIKKDGQGFIFFNQASIESRQRFTIGHELGHWMIPSHLLGDSLSCTKEQLSHFNSKGKVLTKEVRIEIEANRFSAYILMPKREFKEDINQAEPNLCNLFQISQKYNVSMAACCLRFKDLSDYSCAIIHHHSFIIQKILKTKGFPNLDINFKEGGYIAPKSISASSLTTTDLTPSDWRNWLQNKNSYRTELYEQVFQQNNGYRITLLYLDNSQELDEDDLEVERLSEWNPKFKR